MGEGRLRGRWASRVSARFSLLPIGEGVGFAASAACLERVEELKERTMEEEHGHERAYAAERVTAIAGSRNEAIVGWRCGGRSSIGVSRGISRWAGCNEVKQ